MSAPIPDPLTVAHSVADGWRDEANKFRRELSLALDLLERHQWDGVDGCLICDPDGDKQGHKRDCSLAQLLERHGREVQWSDE